MKALLVTLDKYPDLDAGAVRFHIFAKMLKEEGYEVYVISMGFSTNYIEKIESDGIRHISFRGKSQNKMMKATYYLNFPNRLRSHLKHNQYEVIIHSQLDELSLSVLQKYGYKKRIPVIYDSVEWFSECQFKKGKRDRAYRRNNRYNTYLIKKPSSVIAISKYLETNFREKGLKTIRIPVIMDTSETYVKKVNNKDIITILYAGTPGKKDYVANMINALDLLNPDEQKRIKFVILGCTKDQLLNICGVDKTVFKRVEWILDVKGRVPREKVIDEYSKADYSVLIRPTDQRYAMAGFPTKFVESMCCSTPVICNITSDLDEFVVDNRNAIILNKIDQETIANRIKEIIEFSQETMSNMKSCARNTAIRKFDYHYYKERLTDFIIEQLR